MELGWPPGWAFTLEGPMRSQTRSSSSRGRRASSCNTAIEFMAPVCTLHPRHLHRARRRAPPHRGTAQLVYFCGLVGTVSP
ncbi:hypothetical protein ACFFX0_06425 [Citricoccus parietis]|uniref:Uncharacterized protein n=1 Tax=Citricoccus parietis TaxID=592307 RepID=A0ABV5FVZ3_9MICC